VKVRHWYYIRKDYWLWIFRSVGGIVTRLRASWPWNNDLILGRRKRFLSSPKCPDEIWGPLPSYWMGTRGSFPWDNVARHEAITQSPSGVYFGCGWS
jgi:hypothetical protein